MEDLIQKLEKLNPGKKILSVYDEGFKNFGMIHQGFQIDALLDYIERNNKVKDEIVYVADDNRMRQEVAGQLDPIMLSVYGGLDVQTGVCFGRNNLLNGLEFHHGSEVYIVGADMIMMVGLQQDIKWPEGTYDSSLIKFYYAPKGSVVELYGGCMHYAGANVYHEQGINVIVSLLKWTNSPIDFEVGKSDRDELIIGKNTWFIAHPEYLAAREAGWHLGITGENFKFRTF
ncbi:MAG: DUF4867 family protein [Actinobacteria bacterium]|nr:DUF4867 family protein [Actinomycetota bacterium]